MTFIEKYYRDLYLDEGMKEGLNRHVVIRRDHRSPGMRQMVSTRPAR